MIKDRKSECEMLNYEAFILKDTEEREFLSSGNYDNYKKLQRDNRGIIIKNKGGETLNARMFAQYCIEKRISIFRTENGERYVYNHGYHRYEFSSENTIGAILLMIMEEYSKSLFDIKTQTETIKYIDMLCRSYKILPTDNKYLVFSNGTYDMINRKFEEKFWDKDIMNTFIMPYKYNADAECKKFKKFLEDIFNGDKEIISIVQEIFGYTFCYGQAPADKFFTFIPQVGAEKAFLQIF